MAAMIWEEVLEADRDERYGMIDQALYLAEGLFTSIRKVSRIDRSDGVR